ncbi:hypothetical protein [Mycobacterium sp.]|jgi:hypothetical protein|uniref:hypothetical protein n=1 Tax=Mycobacterium sp. TaxID=1785 RepID=UPI002F1E9C9B
MHRRLVPLAVLAAVVFAVVPACSTKKAPEESPTPSTTSAPPQSHGVYESCLTQHGVPSPPAGPPPGPEPVPAGPLPGPVEGTTSANPAPPPPGVDQSTWDNALKACASLQPTTPTSTR